MKKFLVITSLFLFQSTYACEIMNKNFNFIYNIDPINHQLSYEINKKDSNSFLYFNGNYSQAYKYGLTFNDKLYESNNNLKTINEKYKYFYLDSQYYSSYILDKSGSIAIPSEKLPDFSFIKNDKIIGSFQYVNFIENIEGAKLKPLAFGKKKIYFEFRFILNNDISQCIAFKTKEIDYDFGGMFKRLYVMEKNNENK